MLAHLKTKKVLQSYKVKYSHVIIQLSPNYCYASYFVSIKVCNEQNLNGDGYGDGASIVTLSLRRGNKVTVRHFDET